MLKTVCSSPLVLSHRAQVNLNTCVSLLEFNFSDSRYPAINSWGAQRVATGRNSVTVNFFTPPDAVIGRYFLSLLTSEGRTRFASFVLLFNPWAQADVVYLSDDAERQEYVLSEFGLIYLASNPNPIAWNFGQFQENILNVSLALLDSTSSFRSNAAEDVRKRNNPVHVCRVLSSILNSMNNNGVIEGNWSGEYFDGTDPYVWNGSTEILRSWYGQRQPVKYGQCWVFAGTSCTVSRSLGLPCRVITNYQSAHDTDHNLSIEQYFNTRGEAVPRSEDSIWNFHCWNESWFLRLDLGDFYSGWQVWDSTPQEKSDGLYQLGPTSQRAVKEGEVDLLFDTPFVLAEVDADVIIYIVQDDGTVTKAGKRENDVGQLICTKAVGQKAMNDVTLEYKYKDGSSKERETYEKARSKIRGSEFEAMSRALVSSPPPPEVTGTITVAGTPTVGDDINVTLTLKNMTSDNKTVTVNLSAAAIVYNHAVRKPILSNSAAVQLGPNEAKGVPVQIKYSQYEKQLTSDKMIYVTAVYKVEGKPEKFVEANIVLLNPTLQVKALKTAIFDSPMVVEVTFKNPLSTPITGCVLKVEGSGLTKDVIEKNMGQLEPGQKTSVKVEFIPYMVGDKELLVNLACDKFKDIKGHLSIKVQSSSSRLRACCF
ncbi:protein-glutamine gamma-glutamyltransferase E isoform X2 [Xenopus tropicalis]|uniref:protein-glutamine gamma-glutamyltransferase n=1 Tax=Xenopus tropicalis TaxID=8364 RepID=A0A803JY64_XENTR|nr:protein-glutamine gamma-glutamyltransferase E isoform X2 [Xenopus tropicalis]